MMTNEMNYRKQINTNEYYKVSIKGFVEWLKENKEVEEFKRVIAKRDNYSIATDYMIPIIMVKYFKKNTI